MKDDKRRKYREIGEMSESETRNIGYTDLCIGVGGVLILKELVFIYTQEIDENETRKLKIREMLCLDEIGLVFL